MLRLALLLLAPTLAGCPCNTAGCADTLTLAFARDQLTPGPWQATVVVDGFELSCPFTLDAPLPGTETEGDTHCLTEWTDDEVLVSFLVSDRVPQLLEVEVAFADDRPQTQLVYVPAPLEVNPLGCSPCSAWSTDVDLD